LGHDALNTSKIHSKFILCQKDIISIARSHCLSHFSSLLCGETIEEFEQPQEAKLLVVVVTTMGCFTLDPIENKSKDKNCRTKPCIY